MIEKKEYTNKIKYIKIPESVAQEKVNKIKGILSKALSRYKDFNFPIDSDRMEVVDSEKTKVVPKR